jgi:hypothetical protein
MLTITNYDKFYKAYKEYKLKVKQTRTLDIPEDRCLGGISIPYPLVTSAVNPIILIPVYLSQPPLIL